MNSEPTPDVQTPDSPSGNREGVGFAPIPSDEQRLAREVVAELVARGIKVLALDFDMTIVSVHTAGCWRQDTAKLAAHVRPCFRELIRAALESPLYVCVVTYSMQPVLIRDVLKMVLPKCDMHQMLIRANSKDWLPPQPPAAPRLGKQQHIAWIVTELFNRKHAIIHSSQILLMDDDMENVEIALEFGHQAYEVPEEVSLEGIADYVRGVEVRVEPAVE